jgi:signal transduction histidine kinase
MPAEDRLSVADRFDSDRLAIFRGYESRLRALGSALVSDRAVWAECRRYAEVIVSGCAQSIRQGEVCVDGGYLPRATGLGLAAAAADIDLRETVRAVGEVHQPVAAALAGSFAPWPDGLALHRVALAALSQSVSSFTQALWSWHDLAPCGPGTLAQLGNRQWLAREIHDWIGNYVSLAARQLDLYGIYRDRDAAAADARIAALRRTLDELLGGTRQLVSNLRSRRAGGGIGAALREYVRAVDCPDTAVDIVLRGDEALVPPDYTDELLAVVREAVRNALAHARAGTVRAEIDITAAEVWMRVADDGVGFDPAADPPALRGGGGLASMQERVRLLSGELLITSDPTRGTHVQIRIPLGERHVDVS